VAAAAWSRLAPNGPQNLDPKQFEEMLKKFFTPEEGHPENEQFGGVAMGTGSGFVYDDRGHIVTNNHVVENAGKIVVKFHDGVEASAKVVGTDPEADVAVIKVDTTNYPALPRGQSGKLRVGELIMAVGSPFGLSQSVTTGIVSATERNDVGINAFESFIQTDAAINPGNSGGPLVNMAGQVVGVNSAIVTRSSGNEGVGFAIPIDMAGTLADNLIKFGKVRRARVGISLEPLTPAFARQVGLDSAAKGVVVGYVVPGSPADTAGFKPGDVITGFNGSPIASVPNFRLIVSASEAGKEFTVKYWRDGREATAKIVPASSENVVFPQERTARATPKADAEKDKDKDKEPETVEVDDFGIELQPLTDELAKQFGHAREKKGLLVSTVKPGSPAEAAGLEAGQLVTKVVKDRKVQPVSSVKEFESLVKGTDELALYVETPSLPGRFVTLAKPKKN